MLVETVALREYRGRNNWANWRDVNPQYSRCWRSTEQANVCGLVKKLTSQHRCTHKSEIHSPTVRDAFGPSWRLLNMNTQLRLSRIWPSILTSILCFRKSAATSTAWDALGERNHSLIFPFASRRSDVLTIWIIPTLETPQNISKDVLYSSIMSAKDTCKPAHAYRSVKMSNEAAAEMSYASAVKGDTGSTRSSVTSEGCWLRLCMPQTRAIYCP